MVPSNVRIITSTISGTDVLAGLETRGALLHELTLLGRDERHELTRVYLSAYGKQLVADQLQDVSIGLLTLEHLMISSYGVKPPTLNFVTSYHSSFLFLGGLLSFC